MIWKHVTIFTHRALYNAFHLRINYFSKVQLKPQMSIFSLVLRWRAVNEQKPAIHSSSGIWSLQCSADSVVVSVHMRTVSVCLCGRVCMVFVSGHGPAGKRSGALLSQMGRYLVVNTVTTPTGPALSSSTPENQNNGREKSTSYYNYSVWPLLPGDVEV